MQRTPNYGITLSMVWSSVLSTYKTTNSFSVGLVSIKKEEADRMKLKTARNILKPQEYVVTPQVFHDLHCVEWLREFFWTAVNGTFVVDAQVRYSIPHYGQYHWNKRRHIQQTNQRQITASTCSVRVCPAMQT